MMFQENSLVLPKWENQNRLSRPILRVQTRLLLTILIKTQILVVSVEVTEYKTMDYKRE